MSEEAVQERKLVKAVVHVYYQGGTRMTVKTSQDRGQLEFEIEAARKQARDIRIEEIPDPEKDLHTAESYVYLSRTNLLCYNIVTPKEGSQQKPEIVIAPANIALPKLVTK